MGFRIHQENQYPAEDLHGKETDYSKRYGDINPEYSPIDKAIDEIIRKNGWEERDLIVVLEGVVREGLHRHIICPLIFEECLGDQIMRHFWACAWWRFVDVEKPIKIIAVVPADEFCYEDDFYC